MTGKAQTQTVIRFDDIFYLRHKNGQYLVSVDTGKYNWPKLDNAGQVKLQLKGKGKEKTENLKDGDTVKIRSLETILGDGDILGAFSDSHDCYYWKDGYDNEEKQSWCIHKVSSDSDVIRYGDEVYITNVSYQNQRLVADTQYPGYITTQKNASDSWIIESADNQQPVVESNTSNPASVFGLSIASGDPSDRGVILWTRVNPEAYDLHESLKYEVCETKKFDEGVIKGEVEASKIDEKKDYTVHVDLHGNLKPGKTYFYRFLYKGVSSKIGRCKTLPAQDAAIEKLRLAVLTCNDYSTGYFNAFYHLAEEDVDFVIHLGDFVYEYSQYPPGYGDVFRTDMKFTDTKGIPKLLDAQRTTSTSLEDFRYAYRTYRQDLALQAAMEEHTWIITLDDHEIADNCYWDYEHSTMDINAKDAVHPIYQHLNKDSQEARDAMKQLFNNAIQTWREYIPAKIENVDKAKDSTTPHDYKLYRQFKFGSLVDFFLTDSRTCRDKPDLELNAKILEKAKEEKQNNSATNISEIISTVRQQMNLPEWKASMLGKAQKEWLIGGVTKSNATWKVWGNQTLLATAAMNEWMGEIDDWHGFKAERYEILQAVKDSETAKYGNKASHFVVLTGDMHTSMISYLKTGFEGILNKTNWDYSTLAGVEFMTPSMTSPGVSEGAREEIKKSLSPVPGASEVGEILEKLPNLPFMSGNNDSNAGKSSVLHKALTAELIKRHSPHIEHFDSSINGYAIAEFTRDELRWKVYAIDKTAYDKATDGRNLSKKGANKHLAQSAKYDPNTIKLDD